jgi:hypothetical protein
MTPEIPRLKQQNSGSRIVNFHPQVSPQLPAVLGEVPGPAHLLPSPQFTLRRPAKLG